MQDEGRRRRARERAIQIALNVSCDLPRAAACRLGVEIGSWIDAAAGGAAPAAALGLPPAALDAALALRARAPAIAAAEERRVGDARATLAALADDGYPRGLHDLDFPPPALYVRGRVPDGPAVAIVGARRASRYGRETALWLGRELAARGVRVVSGFAVGIDAAAHRGALEAEGVTIAVLGCGLDVDYPRGHRALGREIAERGALVSEFPLGRLPAAWQFPVRNRLIAALAGACVVVEAAARSGSLVTARLALELGREVLAVPGRVDEELAFGTNRLIADGARPVLAADDVLDALGLARSQTRPPAPRTPPPELAAEPRRLWIAAAEEPAAAETLAARSGVAVERALAALLELELVGQLRRAPDGRYEVPG